MHSLSRECASAHQLGCRAQELSEKTNHLGGTAGPRRATIIAAIAKDKEKSVLSVEAVLHGPAHRPEPGSSQSPVKAEQAKLIIPPPISPSFLE